MPEKVKIIECPRDAWQGLQSIIPAEEKAGYLQALVSHGFKHMDTVSFVSPKAVPQMADSEEVLKLLDPPDDVEIIGIVVNEKGAQRAIATQAVQTLGFPYSVSPTFLQRNQKQSLEDALQELEKIHLLAYQADINVVAYISMAFGNPYGDPWDTNEVVEATGLLADMAVTEISLADTVGVADPARIAEVVGAVISNFEYLELGVHLHSRPDEAQAKVLAAFDAGCRRFDSAIGGLGGCPFAQDTLVGNIPTEAVMAALKDKGVSLPQLRSLEHLRKQSAEIAEKHSH